MALPLPTFPLRSPAAWRGSDLRDPALWTYVLTPTERAWLLEAPHMSAGGDGSPWKPTDDASARSLGLGVGAWRHELRDGRGFLLVRGVPVEGRSRDEAGASFQLLGAALGAAVPQNQQGELLCDIRDTGADPTDPNTRLYTTRAEQDFHTDGADLIGLLCLQTAKRGGQSRIVSSITVVNELARKHPRLAALLFEPWRFHLPGPPKPGFPTFFDLPICRWDHQSLATFYIGWYLRNAQTLEGAIPFRPEQRDALVAFEETANDPRLYLDMDLLPGDMQWLKNASILHKRTAYEDFAEETRKRHLLRLWLAASDFVDGDARLRRGIAVDDDEGAGDGR